MTNLADAECDPKVLVALVGVDGNALSLLGTWRRAAREQGWEEAAIDAVSAEAMAGDYHHLIATLADHSDPGMLFGDGAEVWQEDGGA